MKKQIGSFQDRLKLAFINLFESPWRAAITSGIIYVLVSAFLGNLFQQSPHPYYNYLSDAFINGQTSLRKLPLSIHDLSFYNGKYYLYWPPFPAIILIPFIAIFGVGLNDVFYTLLVAALNVGLVAQLLRTACKVDFLHLSKLQRALLVFFFAFGTVHFTLAPFGKVWMTGQLIGFACTLLAYLAAFTYSGKKAWFFTGLALSGAMLTRNHLVFTGVFPLLYLLISQKPWKNGKITNYLFMGFLPLSISALTYLFYNYVRFDNFFDTGVSHHIMAEFFRSNYEIYGPFNLHYVPTNLYYQYIFYPFPIRSESAMGGSLFLLSPLFFVVFLALWKPRDKTYVAALMTSIIITNIPILLLMGTGWVQFGPRYTLDFFAPLLLLLALGIEKIPVIISFILTLISVFHYFIGVKLIS